MALAGCASTTVVVEPPAPRPICTDSGKALVLWTSTWRPDQKDIAAREEAAAAGLSAFLTSSGCFAHWEIRRVPALPPPAATEAADPGPASATRLVGIEVRELGPVVKLLGSAAMIEGGTEVVLRIVDYAPPSGAGHQELTVHWRNGGPGVVKGVASLPDDMREALAAGLQPRISRR